MLIYNSMKLKEINNWEDSSIFVLIDFDKTITSPESYGSWDIIINNKNISDEYKEEVNKLFKYYRPIEIDETIDFELRKKSMIDWWNKEKELFIKYNISKDIIIQCNKIVNLIKFRSGAKEFLYNMKLRKIPVIIFSAGIGDFIEKFLQYNNCYYKNIFVVSNFLKFNNQQLIGFKSNIIHSLNKDLINLPKQLLDLIKYKDKVILFGDSISDINMSSGIDKDNLLSIGFLEDNIKLNLNKFKQTFDVVATDNTSLNDITKKIKILKR